MQDREGAACGSERASKLRWWQLNPAQKTLHATGLWHDADIKRYEHNAAAARSRHDRLAARHGKLAEQLNGNERLAATALDKLRPEAERVLSQRQREAETARAALEAIREAATDRQYQRERTRGHDRGLGR